MNDVDKPVIDAFICHASEDKDPVARPIAESLRQAGLTVWYDEFSLKLGASLRQSIEKGIAKSRFGVVVFSPSFFQKNWPQAELNGLFTLELNGINRILPVWHNLTQQQLATQSPILADKVAANTSEGIDRVVDRILDEIEPNFWHRTKSNVTVAVQPSKFRLGTDQWSVVTSVHVYNRSETTVHALHVKIVVQAGNIKTEDLDINLTDEGRSDLRAKAGPLAISGDALMLDCVDSSGRSAVFVVIHTLPAHASRELIIRGRTKAPGDVNVEVSSFEMQPQEFMQAEGKIAQIVKAPESMTIRAIRFKTV